MIDVHSLTKRYGSTTVVDDLTFTVAPGVVSGFLGPNGAGRLTTMRMLMGPRADTSRTGVLTGYVAVLLLVSAAVASWMAETRAQSLD